MLLSRGSVLSRLLVQSLSKAPRTITQNQAKRLSHAWSYRVGAPPHSKATLITAQLVGGIMWYWVLYHLWHEYEHITGEFEYPNPAEWTNAELGIPPDDE